MNVDGIEYVPVNRSSHVAVIAPNGWIFEGKALDDGEPQGHITLMGAHVVRRWDNGLGIGGLADPAHKDDYTLDPIGTITVHQVVAVIELRW